MSNRVYIDTVEVRYLRLSSTDSHVCYGLFIWDDYEHCSLLEFNSESEIPSTLESILAYCLQSCNDKAWELISQNVHDGQSVCLNNVYFMAEDVLPLIDAAQSIHEVERAAKEADKES